MADTTAADDDLRALALRLDWWPTDWDTRQVLADWYEEHGDRVAAAAQRWQIEARKRPWWDCDVATGARRPPLGSGPTWRWLEGDGGTGGLLSSLPSPLFAGGQDAGGRSRLCMGGVAASAAFDSRAEAEAALAKALVVCGVVVP